MKILLVPVAAAAMLAAAVSFLCFERSSPQPAAMTTHAEGTKLLSRLPVAFVPNLGQWEHPARYVARFGGMTVFLEDKGCAHGNAGQLPETTVLGDLHVVPRPIDPV